VKTSIVALDVGIFLIVGSISYAVLAAHVGTRLAGKALRFQVSVLLVTALVVLGIAAGFHGGMRFRVAGACVFLLDFVCLLYIVWFLSGWLYAGKALLVLPRMVWQRAMVFVAIIQSVNMAFWLSRWDSMPGWDVPEADILRSAIVILQVEFVAYALLACLIPMQVRDEGLLCGTFVPWSVLKSYAWTGPLHNVLTLKSRRTLSGILLLLGETNLKLPAD
jgi:hypothetical protein